MLTKLYALKCHVCGSRREVVWNGFNFVCPDCGCGRSKKEKTR